MCRSTRMVQVLVVIVVLATGSSLPASRWDKCDYYTNQFPWFNKAVCNDCHVGDPRRSGNWQLRKLSEVPDSIKNTNEFKRNVQRLFDRTGSSWNMTSNTAGDRNTGNNTTLLGVGTNTTNTGIRTTTTNTTRTNQPVSQPTYTNPSYTAPSGNLFGGTSRPVVSGNLFGGQPSTAPASPGVAEVTYVLQRGDDFNTVVNAMFTQELIKRGAPRGPTQEELATLLQMVRSHNAARWSFGNPQAGDTVGIPVTLLDQYAALVKQSAQQNQPPQQPVETPTPTSTYGGSGALGFQPLTPQTAGTTYTYQPNTTATTTGSNNTASAALQELQGLESGLGQVFSGGVAGHILVTPGTNSTNYSIKPATVQKLKQTFATLLENGLSPTRQCPIGIHNELAAIRDAIDALSGTLTYDLHVFGLGQEGADKKAEAIRIANEKISAIKTALSTLKTNIRAWQS